MQLSRFTLSLAGATGLFAGVAEAQIDFHPAATHSLLGQRPDWVAIGDFDDANGPDLAVTSGSPQGQNGPDWVEIFNNLGNGTFVAGQQIFMGNNVGSAAVVAEDFDGDGDMDLAVSLKNIGTVQTLLNTGGLFSAGPSVAVGGSEPRHMASADIDEDGDMDLVASNRNSNNLSVLLNNGSGAFSLSGVVPVGLEPRYLVLADFNGDTITDVAVASHDSRRVDVLNGTGGGGFGGMVSYPVPGNEKPSGMVAADFDQDGDLDLATTTDNNNIGLICVMTNVGGTFTSACFLNGGQNPGAVIAADLDLDGDLDLAAADEDSNFISAHVNNGGFFGGGSIFPVGAHPSHLAHADLDGNSSDDLATVNRDSNTLSVLLNVAEDGGIGTSYCGPATTNSSGGPASISASGSTSAAANDVTLEASGMPAGEFGYFLTSQTQGFFMPPGSDGFICLGGDIGRYNGNVGQGPSFSLQIDLTNMPVNPPQAVLAGDTWNFQAWYRDIGNSNNFTDAVVVTFQ